MLLEVLNWVIFTSCVSFNCENIFEIFWECSCASHIIKTTFQLFFDKISKFSLVQLIEANPRPIKIVQFLGQNSMDGSILVRMMLNRLKSLSVPFRLLLNFSRLIEIWIFKILKGLTYQFCPIFSLFSSIPLNCS